MIFSHAGAQSKLNRNEIDLRRNNKKQAVRFMRILTLTLKNFRAHPEKSGGAGPSLNIWFLKRGRKSLWNLDVLPNRCPLQRLDGTCFIEVQDGVELIGKQGMKVMA
jgi:hypothetical protein